MRELSNEEFYILEKLKKLITLDLVRGLNLPIDPERSFQEWEDRFGDLVEYPFRQGNSVGLEERVRRLALEVFSPLSRSSIVNYRNGRGKQLSAVSIHGLQTIEKAFGFKVTEIEFPKGRPRGKRTNNRVRQIALITEFCDLASLEFHRAILEGLIVHAERHHYSPVIHQVTRTGLTERVEKLMQIHAYDGLVFVRLLPDESLCMKLKDRKIPVVLVHGDMRENYDLPVIANVYPDQRNMGSSLTMFIQANLYDIQDRAKNIVVVHMPRECTQGSIRDQRIDILTDAADAVLGQVNVIHQVIEDYHFSRGFEIINQYDLQGESRTASSLPDFWVVLADQVGLCIQQILKATGRTWKNRIIGFDGLLKEIPSIGQDFDATGAHAIEALVRGFKYLQENDGRWPQFESLRTNVKVDFGSHLSGQFYE